MFLKLTARWGRGRYAARRTRLLVLLSPVNSTSKKLFRSFRSVFLCHLLQNQTLTTAVSSPRQLPSLRSSPELGRGSRLKAASSTCRWSVSMTVRFLRLLACTGSYLLIDIF